MHLIGRHPALREPPQTAGVPFRCHRSRAEDHLRQYDPGLHRAPRTSRRPTRPPPCCRPTTPSWAATTASDVHERRDAEDRRRQPLTATDTVTGRSPAPAPQSPSRPPVQRRLTLTNDCRLTADTPGVPFSTTSRAETPSAHRHRLHRDRALHLDRRRRPFCRPTTPSCRLTTARTPSRPRALKTVGWQTMTATDAVTGSIRGYRSRSRSTPPVPDLHFDEHRRPAAIPPA